MRDKLLFIPLLLLLPFAIFSQTKPSGKFQKQVVKIGEHVQYTLSVRYPSEENIVFPDSTYSYLPFEFVSKKFFNTVSDSATSLDSVVYTLATFEIDSVQHLAIPVFLIEEGDSTKLFPEPDSILISPSLTQIPDSIALMVNTNYVEVKREFNYTYFIIGLLVFIILATLVVFLFGKKVLQYLKVRRLRKKHLDFLLAFKQYRGSVTRENYEEQLLNAYGYWKKYLQQLTNKSFTSYSTKEIFGIVKDENLKETLKEIDRAIYAHRYPAEPDRLLNVLMEYGQFFFEEKIINIKNGSTK